MNKLFLIVTLFLCVSCSKDDNTISSSIDVEQINTFDRLYSTVKIGKQIWMAENFAYLDDEILNSGAFVYNYNGSKLKEAKSLDEYKLYGVLYNYNTALKICPNGWRLPTDDDWKELEQFIGMTEEQVNIFGVKDDKGLKRGDKSILDKLIKIYYGGNNKSGLSIVLGGSKDNKGFCFRGVMGNFWTSSLYKDNKAMIRGFAPLYIPAIQRGALDKDKTFLSVRYIKN